MTPSQRLRREISTPTLYMCVTCISCISLWVFRCAPKLDHLTISMLKNILTIPVRYVCSSWAARTPPELQNFHKSRDLSIPGVSIAFCVIFCGVSVGRSRHECTVCHFLGRNTLTNRRHRSYFLGKYNTLPKCILRNAKRFLSWMHSL